MSTLPNTHKLTRKGAVLKIPQIEFLDQDLETNQLSKASQRGRTSREGESANTSKADLTPPGTPRPIGDSNPTTK